MSLRNDSRLSAGPVVHLLLFALILTTGCATNTFVQGTNVTFSQAWDSGRPGTVLSVNCTTASGPRNLFAGLEGFKEPGSNLDRFIASLDIFCIEYRNHPTLGYAQNPNSGDRITVTTTTDFRTNAGEVSINVGQTGIPVGLTVTHGRKSYVQNLALVIGSVQANADGTFSVVGHSPQSLTPGARTGPTITDYPTANFVGGATQRANFRELDCPTPQVMTGIELTVDATKDKIRKVRIMCQPLTFIGGAPSE